MVLRRILLISVFGATSSYVSEKKINKNVLSLRRRGMGRGRRRGGDGERAVGRGRLGGGQWGGRDGKGEMGREGAVAQCVARRAPICSNAYGGRFAPHPRHSVRMTYRPSAALRLLRSLRISHNNFLRASK